MSRIVILYSGGVDSTAAASIIAKQFDRVDLLSFKRSGLFHVGNTAKNVSLLEAKFGKDKFFHSILDVEKLFRMIYRLKYFQGLKKYGFFLLSTCGLCKLTMHIRALIYCLDNDIHYVADGANKHMLYFPDQTTEYIDEIKKLYSRFHITYFNPVFDFDCPEEDIDWLHKLGVETLATAENGSLNKKHTTSQFLFEEGFFDTVNAKADKMNQEAQARCFQLTLSNIFLHWYFLPSYGTRKYSQFTSAFYGEKVRLLSNMTQEYLDKKEKSSLIEYLK